MSMLEWRRLLRRAVSGTNAARQQCRGVVVRLCGMSFL